MIHSLRIIALVVCGLRLVCSLGYAQQSDDDTAADSIQSARERIEASLERANISSDPQLVETLDSLKLLLELNPPDRRRFVLPRPADAGKNQAERIKRLFANDEGLKEFRESLDSLVTAIDLAAISAEKQQDWDAAYRLRWQWAGLHSVLPNIATGKQQKKSLWSHSEVLLTQPEAKRAFANHPKTLWPAGSYTVVTTPHFEVASQSDNKAATLEVATLCEQSFAVWKQVFFGVWAGKQITAPNYDRTLDHRFSVVLFRNREAYAKALRSVPGIGVSTGYYDPNQKVASFYWDGTKTPSTVVHELTHQFFYEASNQPVTLDTDRGRGFWVVEGAALYMESFSSRVCGGSLLADVGGWDSPRLQAGRYRRLHDSYWIPWEEFRSADGKRMRGEEDIRAWYSQSAGLAHLWLDGTAARQRDFASYLESVYNNRETSALLADWNEDQKLRDAFDRYLILGPSTSAFRPFFSNRREAVLCRSRLSSSQILDWPNEYRTSPWLDLSFSQVDDGLFVVVGKAVSPNWNVQRLNLESTKVTDISMPAIAQGKGLSELDLSNCAISDSGLAAFQDHKSLKILWLNQCPVTDDSIDVLISIPQLESVHLLKTQVSATGWSRLLAAKPRLRSKSTGP